jgi:hypothetical protein
MAVLTDKNHQVFDVDVAGSNAPHATSLHALNHQFQGFAIT